MLVVLQFQPSTLVPRILIGGRADCQLNSLIQVTVRAPANQNAQEQDDSTP